MTKRIAVDVKIWPLEVSAPRLAALRAVLSQDETARLDRFSVQSAAREFIASRGMVREHLALEFGCEPHAVKIGIGARGKPHLEQPLKPLAFNLSHSSGYCALATGNVGRLGVDIEGIRATIDDFASSVFSPGEAAQYAAIDADDRMRTFFRAWVAKEAFLKATGEGLAGGLKSLELNLTAGLEIDPIAIRGDPAPLARWHFRGFDVSKTVVGAIAVETDASEIELNISFIDPERTG